jgi:membrane-bound lytic murein transglycosylase B
MDMNIPQRSLLNLVISLFFLVATLVAGSSNASDISQREDVQQFINEMVKKHHFEKPSLLALFSQVKLQKRVEKAIASPAEAKPWYKYRAIFLTRSRIDGGVKFWKENATVLADVEKRFGVPPEIITAIIGVETRYSKHTGGFRVIDSLSTLTFNYPKRSKFFRKELEQFLLLCKEEKADPLQLTGSYAGAMGIPQFMPSSFRHYAADFEGDGKKDIWKNTADVIASVANYFTIHGWQQGEAVAFPVSVEGEKYKNIIGKSLKPKQTLATLQANGVNIGETKLPLETTARLLSLQQKKGTEEWAILTNFYVITRYNHSDHYAMAVYQLSQEIKSRHARLVSK